MMREVFENQNHMKLVKKNREKSEEKRLESELGLNGEETIIFIIVSHGVRVLTSLRTRTKFGESQCSRTMLQR